MTTIYQLDTKSIISDFVKHSDKDKIYHRLAGSSVVLDSARTTKVYDGADITIEYPIGCRLSSDISGHRRDMTYVNAEIAYICTEPYKMIHNNNIREWETCLQLAQEIPANTLLLIYSKHDQFLFGLNKKTHIGVLMSEQTKTTTDFIKNFMNNKLYWSTRDSYSWKIN